MPRRGFGKFTSQFSLCVISGTEIGLQMAIRGTGSLDSCVSFRGVWVVFCIGICPAMENVDVSVVCKFIRFTAFGFSETVAVDELTCWLLAGFCAEAV